MKIKVWCDSKEAIIDLEKDWGISLAEWDRLTNEEKNKSRNNKGK